MSRLSKYLPFAALMNRLDHYLLINHRMVWISKIHYVLYATSLVTLPLTLAALLVPITLRTGVPDWSPLHSFTAALGLIGGIYWVYRITIFNARNQFGNPSRFVAFSILALYIPCVAAFISMTALPWYALQWRGAALMSYSTLDCDICILNTYNYYFMSSTEYESISSTSHGPLYSKEDNYGWRSRLIPGYDYRKIDGFGVTYGDNCLGCIHKLCAKLRQSYELADQPTPMIFNHYINSFRKYGGQINTDLTEVINSSNAEKVLFSGEIDQKVLHEKMKVDQVILSLQLSHGAFFGITFYYRKWIVIVYFIAVCVGTLVIMGIKRIGMMMLLAFTAITLYFIIISGLSIQFFSDREKLILGLYLLAMILGLLIMFMKRRQYSNTAVMMSGICMIIMPFMFIAITKLDISNDLITDDILTFISLAFYAIVILPLLVNRLLTIKALPRA